VKTVKFSNEKYIGDPINTVRIYNHKEVDELIFLDIYASHLRTEIAYDLVDHIAKECFMPFSYGGGIKSMVQVEKLFKLGTEKVIINSQFSVDMNFVMEIAKSFGSQAVIVSMDVKKKYFGGKNVYINHGKKIASSNPIQYAHLAQEHGAGELMVTSIDRDGTMEGYDLELISSISESVSIPVIASGGAGSISDLEKAIVEGKASAVAAGSLFVYQKKNRSVLINYPDRSELTNVY
jgi:imidazole glycerol-phosphate synthase subunit HisF